MGMLRDRGQICGHVRARSHAISITTHQSSKRDNRTAKDFSNSHCGMLLNELVFGNM